MRPLKLTMTAFGPYKHAETIDFGQLGEHRLFAISGNTGAGKTTVFDAIVFALYGAASGEDRDDTRMLRSHFADDDTYTSVDLMFTVRGQKYRVFRQLPHRKEGNKSETGGKAELYRLEPDREVPETDRFAVCDVNQRLQELIGLTCDQFTQIVMLPQGEFRKLLTSETKNKEDILRRIFRTGFYVRMQERLQEERRRLRERLDDQVRARQSLAVQMMEALPKRDDSPLHQVLHTDYPEAEAVKEALQGEINYYRTQIEMQEQAQQQALEQLHLQEEQLLKAREIEQRYAEREEKRRQLKLWEQDEPLYQKRLERLRLAEQAAVLTPYYDQWQQAVVDQERTHTQAEEQARLTEAAEKEWIEAERVFLSEQELEPERQSLARQWERMQSWMPKVRLWSERERTIQTLTDEAKVAEDRLQRGADKAQRLQHERDSKTAWLKEHEPGLTKLADKRVQKERWKQQLRLLEEWISTREAARRSSEELNRQEQQLQQARQQVEQEEAAWRESQAALIAASLKDGEPCPVCGSSHHPHKAVHGGEAIAREQLDQRREQLRQAEQVYYEVKAGAETAASLEQEQAKQLQQVLASSSDSMTAQPVKAISDPIRDPEAARRSLEQRLQTLEDDIEELQQIQKQAEQIRRDREEIEHKLETWRQFREQMMSELSESRSKLQTERALLNQEQEELAAAGYDPERLEAQLAKTEKKREQMQANWEQARQTVESAREKRTRAAADLEHYVRERRVADQRVADAEKAWRTMLQQSGFTDNAAFEQARMKEEERTQLREDCDRYREQGSLLKQQLAQLDQLLAYQERPDLTQLEEDVLRQRQTWQHAVERMQASSRLLTIAESLLGKWDKLQQEMRKQEAEWSLAEDMAKTFRGDNRLRISFERYILIEYMEQIVQAANARLYDLSRGQYMLRRSDRLERNRKQSGLGLDVYDAYTGLERDVKTLSGGEKFKASLSLALGMADVIQAGQGGVSIEMLFIDEGFGALDEESLQQSIDTLVDLQRSGRMIGVISHVPELRQALPAILEVRKDRTGCSRTAWKIT